MSASGVLSPVREIGRVCVPCGAAQHRVVGQCACGRGMVETAIGAAGRAYGGVTADFYDWAWPVLPLSDRSVVHGPLDLRTPLLDGEFLRELAGGGPRVWLKDETALPTGTTKDRAAAVVYPYLVDNGIGGIVLSSTGNTSTSFAAFAEFYPQLEVHIFVGRDFAYRLRGLGSPNVTVHVVNGTFVQAGTAGQKHAREHGLQWEAGFFNPARRDGLKTAFLEAALELGEAPGVYVQAISSAMGVVGAAKAAGELPLFGIEARRPKLLCVQQDSCAPMVTAWRGGRERIAPGDKVARPHGLAKAILRGDPSGAYPLVRNLVRNCDGDFTSVANAEIRAARHLVFEHTGRSVCEASAVAVAGYLGWARSTRPGPDTGPVVINLTGGDRNEIRR
ncbi:pyridoxal-phosphate dependent enzyme [Kutzneria sp. NPDC052558]|uniref:threonine synthase n=1 Tax=Kutzneria sp. NPDC052558 TaxID=3364121 RepID=UPI0037CAAD6A